MKLAQKGNKVWTNNGEFVLCPSNAICFRRRLSVRFRKQAVLFLKQFSLNLSKKK